MIVSVRFMPKVLVAVLTVGGAIAATPAGALAGPFLSPSGKIECYFSRTGASCYNDKLLATQPPSSDDCGSGASALNVDRRGATRVCIGNPFFAKRKPAYGKKIRIENYECASRMTGMTCRNAKNKHGFTLNRAGWKLF